MIKLGYYDILAILVYLMTKINSSIFSLLNQRVMEHLDKIAYAFLKDGTTIGNSLTSGYLNRTAKAIATYREALKLQPNHKVVLQSLETIKNNKCRQCHSIFLKDFS